MRRAIFLGLLTLAGCMTPQPDPSPPSVQDLVHWGPLCLPGSVDATPCVMKLDPDEGSDLEVSLATHPTDPDTVLLAWTSRLGSRAEVWAAITQDAGQRWNVSKMYNPRLGQDPPQSQRYAFDTVVAFSPEGAAYVFYGGETRRIGPALEAQERMTLATSLDAGATWTYRIVTEDPGIFLWDAMDFAASPDSKALYAVAQSVDLRGIWFWRSQDAGDSWSEPAPVSLLPADAYAYWPRVAAGPDGLVVVTAKTLVNEPLVALVSRDGGSTFIRYPLLPSNNGGFLIGDPTYISPSDGRIRIAPAGPRGLQLVGSDDRGKTWSPPVELVPSPNGTPRWSNVAGDAQGTYYALYSRSTAGSWGVELVRWTDHQTTPITSVLAQGTRTPRDGAAGDEYGGVAVAADGAVWAAWSDTRFGSTETVSVLRWSAAPKP